MSSDCTVVTGEAINAQLAKELRQALIENARLRSNERSLRAAVLDLQQSIREITASFTRDPYVAELRQMVQDEQRH